MASILEVQRANHEDIERARREIITLLAGKCVTKKETVTRDHNISACLDFIVDKCRTVESLQEDKDRSKYREVSLLSGKEGDVFSSFFTRVKEIKEYHAKYPDIISDDSLTTFPKGSVGFSSEELYGKHVDLHQIYDTYINIPGVQKISYYLYLDIFHKFEAVHRSIKTHSKYHSYISSLYDYLVDFYKRSQPLVSWSDYESETIASFNEAWEKQTIPGWDSNPSVPGGEEGYDLEGCKSVGELVALGGDALKNMLNVRGLKCGGTVEQRAERLFKIQGLTLDQYPADLLAGSTKKKSPAPSDSSSGGGVSKGGLKAIAEIEFKISSLSELLVDVINATKLFTEKKLVRSFAERQAEALEQEEADRIIANDNAGGSDEEEETIYNPLNLPLGWDGKPIPYWLYKLHGLSVSYNCEICGNTSYRGRRAFELHFQEARHAHGMRCLGIPNTKHFHDIAAIKDAIDLYEKLKAGLGTQSFDPESHEEFEDSEGNVLSSKMYHDLARQGLL